MTNPALLQLLHLADPMLPIGGFAHSAGLETYVQQGTVHNKATAQQFITEMIGRNLHYTDAAFVSLAYQAAADNDLATVLQWDETCTATKLPSETRQASKKLGQRLLKIFEPLIQHPLLINYAQAVKDNKALGNYSVVFGLVAQVLGIAQQEALYGFYYNAAAGFVTNAVKLIPLGQQDGQQLLFDLLPQLQQWAEQSLHPNEDLLGLSCPGFDIRCMQHEQLYSRLYMS
jgi:urease accessory protein